MVWAPSVKQLTVLQQGGEFYPNLSEWTDSIILDGSAKTDYDLTAARLAMGYTAGVAAPLFLQIGATGTFYMNAHAAAVVPITSTATGAASSCNVTNRYIDGTVTTLSFIAPAEAVVTLSFYRP